MTPNKKTFYTFVGAAGLNGLPLVEHYEKPFNFAPYDTLYGLDFDVMVYVGDDTLATMTGEDAMFSACLDARKIEIETGLWFIDPSLLR